MLPAMAPSPKRRPPESLAPGVDTPGRAVTLRDVAKVAGVSAITVSRALSRPDLVTPATLERVREVVSRTGYVPNVLAGSLKSRRSRIVAAPQRLQRGVFESLCADRKSVHARLRLLGEQGPIFRIGLQRNFALRRQIKSARGGFD